MTPSNPSPDTGAGTPPEWIDLAADIRAVDGNHDLGAGALASALTARGWTRSRPAKTPPDPFDPDQRYLEDRPATDPAGLDELALAVDDAMRAVAILRSSGDTALLANRLDIDLHVIRARLSVADGPGHVYDDPARWGERFDAPVADGPGPEERP